MPLDFNVKASPVPAWQDPAKALLWIGLVCGGLFAFLFPPFSIADEPAHFLRVWAISEGHLTPETREGQAGAEVPSSLLRVLALCGQDVVGHPVPRVDREQWRRALAERVVPGDRSFVAIPTTASFPWVRYLPQVVALTVGRWCGFGPLVLFYLARLGGLFASTCLVWWAVKVLPAQRWVAAAVALGPMALTSRAAVSADGWTTGAAWLLAAATLAALEPGAEAEQRSRTLLGAAALIVAKLPYLPLALPAFWITGRRWRWAYIAVCGLAVVWALQVATAVTMPYRAGSGIDVQAQTADVRADPVRAAGIVLNDLRVHGLRYLAQMTGVQLGWLDTRLPLWLVVMGLAIWGTLWLGDRDPGAQPSRGARWIVLGSLLLATGLIEISQYLTWTARGAEFIEGTQGRYFLPLVPFAAWALQPAGNVWTFSHRWRAAFFSASVLLGVAAGVVATYTQFWR